MSRTLPAPGPDARATFARADRAESRGDARLGVAIDDFFLPGDGRLDDRTRAALSTLVAALVGGIAREITGHAARLLAQRGMPTVDTLADAADGVLARLAESGLLRDWALMEELIGRVGQDLLARALGTVPHDGEAPAMSLATLAQVPDGVVAAAAAAMLMAENRRRASAAVRSELTLDLHRRLVWWIAAALREIPVEDAAIRRTLDRALADAATRSIAAHDEGERLEAVAERLAAAIDPAPHELGALLIDTLADACPALFVALIARASAFAYRDARALVLEPEGDRLWLVLRAHGLTRAQIARIALTLAEADPRRDIDAFADELDAVAAIDPAAAAEAIESLRLHPDFRVALRALARSSRR